jgi:hypothetical protein
VSYSLMLSVAQTLVFCVMFCLPLFVFLFFFFFVIELFYPLIVWARMTLLVLSNFFVFAATPLWFDDDFWCFNATFSNISAILWRPVLVVEKVGENHWPWVSKVTACFQAGPYFPNFPYFLTAALIFLIKASKS